MIEYTSITNEGYLAIITFSDLGFRCGYVGVPLGHLAYGRDYSYLDLEVHGGLTFAGERFPEYPNTYWLGFDAGHFGDGTDTQALADNNIPPLAHLYLDGTVRTLPYMIAECEKLAHQLSLPELFI